MKFDKIGDHFIATFTGRFLVEGEYRYGRLTDNPENDASYDLIDLVFVPDAAYRATLPYWYERGPVTELAIENQEEFAATVIGPALMRSIKDRKRHSLTGRAAIWVDRYTVSIECDWPTYSVHFLKVDRPPTVVASNKLLESGCL